jgi:hypothetical protein
MRKLLLLPAAALLLFAGEGIYNWTRSGNPVAVGCNEAHHSTSLFILIAGCDINIAGAGFREAGGQIDELLLPARPVGGKGILATAVVATRDPRAIERASAVFGGGRSADGDQAAEVLNAIVQELQIANVIEGRVRAGFVEGYRTRRILSGLPPPIADDAVIVDLHGQRSIVWPVVNLIAGLTLAALAFIPSELTFGRVKSAAEVKDVSVRSVTFPPMPAPSSSGSTHHDSAPAMEALPDPRQPPPVSATARNTVVLPRLLLLALDVTAGPDSIEAAPPLGSRADVIEILRGLIPDLGEVDARTTLARPDGSVRVDIGRDDPVATAVVQGHGESGVALVKEILLMTGWRAFAPKTGLFMSVDDLDAIAALAED